MPPSTTVTCMTKASALGINSDLGAFRAEEKAWHQRQTTGTALHDPTSFYIIKQLVAKKASHNSLVSMVHPKSSHLPVCLL